MATIEKRGKTYTARISLKVNGKYKRKSKSGFTTKTAAKSWAIEQESLKNKGLNTIGASQLFSDYFENWYKLYKTDITKSSLRWYKHSHQMIEWYLPPVTLEKLTRATLQDFFNTLGQHYAYDTCRKVRTFIKSSIKYAMYDGLIHKDPTLDLTITGAESKRSDLKYLEANQLRDLLKYINDIPVCERNASDCMILISCNTGMRYQEVAALTLNDLSDTSIKVDKAYEQFSKIIKTPKTDSSNRDIEVPNKLITDLRIWATYKKLTDNDFLFSATGIKPLTSAAPNKRLKYILNQIGSDKQITFHGLRHTHATMLLTQRVYPHYVSERLGHSSYLITMDIYAHIFKEIREKEADETITILDKLVD